MLLGLGRVTENKTRDKCSDMFVSLGIVMSACWDTGWNECTPPASVHSSVVSLHAMFCECDDGIPQPQLIRRSDAYTRSYWFRTLFVRYVKR